MKKIIALLLALTCAFALFACGECSHVDENPKDAKCDKCGAAVSCAKCVDADPADAKCDVCGKDVECEECVDEDPLDGVCDVCGGAVECEECVDVDPRDGKCDVCGEYVECEECIDENPKDAKCDACGEPVPCTACVDADKNAKCDVCGKDVACDVCVDANIDGKCDVCGKTDTINRFGDFEDAIVATEPESLEGTVTLDTLAGEMKGEYSATVANDGSVTVNYSFDNFNSVSEGGAGDVSSKKVGSVTRDADGNYTYTGDRVATAESVAGTVTSLKLDNSKLVNANISGNALSATVKSANTASVLGVALESDATFVLVINDGKVISFALAYEVEGASVEIVCEYK